MWVQIIICKCPKFYGLYYSSIYTLQSKYSIYYRTIRCYGYIGRYIKDYDHVINVMSYKKFILKRVCKCLFVHGYKSNKRRYLIFIHIRYTTYYTYIISKQYSTIWTLMLYVPIIILFWDNRISMYNVNVKLSL